MRVLILGGYGVFGGRLARLMAGEAGVEMLIAGRSAARAAAFCAGFEGAARVVPLALDRAEVPGRLAGLGVDVVVDASGPFQDYGADPYGVVRAAVAAGVEYLDLADGAGFVEGIAGFDGAARAAGVRVLSGVSSFPVLTAAVLAEVAREITPREVVGGIAPSPYAGIGVNVMRAVLGYAGAPVRVWREGRVQPVPGLGESRAAVIAAPGGLPLRALRFSLVDVPDNRVIPLLYPSVRSMWMGAAPQPGLLLRVLNGAAHLRARGLLPPLAPLAPLAHLVLNRLRLGAHRGGMFIRVEGVRDGLPAVRTWHLAAEGDDGPFIPSMAVAILLKQRLAGVRGAPGARAAAGCLTLADYKPEFAGRRIAAGFRDEVPGAPLYRRVLGAAFGGLPGPLRALHDPQGEAVWQGRAAVERGPGLLARGVAWLFGFPPAAEDVPVTVTLRREGAREHWQREFGGARFASWQEEGRGRHAHLIRERFGAIVVDLALVVVAGRLELHPRGWALWGLPLPRALLPRGETFEAAEGDRFRFHVTIAAPLVGLIVRYRGWLRPAGKA